MSNKEVIKAERDIFGKAVMRELKAYKTEIQSKINDAAKENAKKLKQELRKTSPEGKRGRYKKGWITQKMSNRTYIVRNDTDWQLTHLLEEGHYIHGGTYFVQPIPHIQPARDKIEKEFLSEVEEAIQNAK